MQTFAERLTEDLPIFLIDRGGAPILYAPGHIVVPSEDQLPALEASLCGGEAPNGAAGTLQRHARRARRRWEELGAGPLEPHCLTIYLSNCCNLGCSYCFTRPWARDSGERETIAPGIVEAAAHTVARSCASADLPLQVVMHGGGEPTVHGALVRLLVEITRRVAREHGTAWWGHIATNGVMSRRHAVELAETFDSIGLSCDGPPDIHDRQRPLCTGGTTSQTVMRTAAILRKRAADFTVRTTITPETFERQAEIAAWICDHLGPREMRFEPVYRTHGQGEGCFQPGDAGPFATHFLEAQSVAADRGCNLNYSGVRLEEIHGSYCHVLRNALQLTPDGTASCCFACVDGDDETATPRIIGRVDPASGRFEIDQARVAQLRRRATEIAARCRDCVALYHCARECPEVCTLGNRHRRELGFRCLVNRDLTLAWIRQAACGVREERGPVRSSALDEGAERLRTLLADVPTDVDTGAIIEHYEALRRQFSVEDRALPMPVWARRGYEHDPEEAMRRVEEAVVCRAWQGPISVYVHVPFCRQDCGFCDCYSLPLPARERRREIDFTESLLAELAAWSRLGGLAQRPCTTVHLGGGTPNCLRPSNLEMIVAGISDRLPVNGDTEWALESTAQLLNGEHAAMLWNLGFRRLHIGVQTLEEPLRRQIGRLQTSAEVLRRIGRALSLGFVVSVDMIYGLPGDTFEGFVSSLSELIEVGVHGFSLYELQSTSRNRQFLATLDAPEAGPLRDYAMLQVGEQVLTAAGYRKNHFAHFALPPDRNRYYTHARRGEDLLALGPTADGLFGDYHYRHPKYDSWCRETRGGTVGLEGGVRETPAEARASGAVAQILTASIDEATIAALELGPVLSQWIDASLVCRDEEADSYRLTGNGSWLVAPMIEQILAMRANPQEGGGET